MSNMLYHYTSADAFLNIIKSGKIWLTDVTKMNDPHELSFGLEIIKEALHEMSYNNSEIDFFCKKIDEERKNNIYLSCSFSNSKDDLSQWRSYSDNGQGFCIGFDAEKLKEICCRNEDDSSIYMSNYIPYKIHYDKDSFKEYISELLPKGESLRGANRVDILITLMFSCFVKDPIYRVERESRIVQFLHVDELLHQHTKNRLMGNFDYSDIDEACQAIKYRPTNYGLAVYTELDVISAISEVWIGPNNKNSIEEINRFLKFFFLHQVRVDEIGHKYRG